MSPSQDPPKPKPLPQSFLSKKRRILEALAVPVSEYDDLSPKGSIDVGIRDLIDEINALKGCVTTSSCAGRISVFLEGKKSKVEGYGDDGEAAGGEGERTIAGVGGKGGGGRWLFVSHDPIDLGKEKSTGDYWQTFLGMRTGEAKLGKLAEEKRFVHFKFEPMILHIQTASPEYAQLVLSAALQAGFRESGALNITSSSTEAATPMVGIRSMGLSLESVVGFEHSNEGICMVPEWQLRTLVEISNIRFAENTKRIERFRTLLREFMRTDRVNGTRKKEGDAGEWENKDARRERKRAEGLKKAQALKEAGKQDLLPKAAEVVPDIEILERDA